MAIDKNTIQKPFWAIRTDDALEILHSSKLGISEEEAQERRKIFGQNKIVPAKKGARLKIFLRQFKSPLIYILVIADIITVFLNDINDAIFIFIAIAVNTSLGFYQENKAERALESLSNYLEKKTKVTRGGQPKVVNVEELVPGDIINFSSGDNIPADGRIIHSNNLYIDESILTGESLPEEKGAHPVALMTDLGDKTSMVFSGTSVIDGIGSAVIVSTGPDTELGNIATLVADVREITPLQKNISSFANKLSIAISFLAIIIFTLGIFYNYSVLEMFTMSVAIAVAAVPEGLTIAMTVILAVGVERLAKKKGVVKRLLSAETLGDTSVILTDKTGTLTQAKMSLVGIDVPQIKDSGEKTGYQKEILETAVLCTDAYVENLDKDFENWRIVGKPLDVALVKGAKEQFGLNEPDIRKGKIVSERLPFNSQNKFSGINLISDGHETTIIIGAPEVIIKLCHKFKWGENQNITEEEKDNILRNVDQNAREGHRIISVASRDSSINLSDAKKIDGFSYMGNILLKDTIRKGVGAVIHEIEEEGIKTVIVTGDHAGTAISIAEELGMKIDGNSVIDQHELDIIDDKELLSRLPNMKIFSRITPQTKVRIAKAFQNAGHIVAMTGDGVNDAPALKQADVGIAIGGGSEVAKESADLVLLDDSFKTIVTAIDEGRRILQNIRKVVVFCLTNLFDELLLVGGSIMLGMPVPITAAQILWVNFITDSLPTISLSYEDEITAGKNIRGKIKRESVFDKEVKFLVWVVGVLTSILLFALYYLLLKSGQEESLAKTFIFASLGLYTLLLIFSIRSLGKNIWNYNPFSNTITNVSSFIGILLMMLAIYNPSLQRLLGTTALPTIWLMAVFLVSLSCLIMVEIGKFLFIQEKTTATPSATLS